MITGMEKSGKILENYEADLENTAFHYIGSYSMRLLPCFHYISPNILWSKFWYCIDIGKDDMDPSLLPAPPEV